MISNLPFLIYLFNIYSGSKGNIEMKWEKNSHTQKEKRKQNWFVNNGKIKC